MHSAQPACIARDARKIPFVVRFFLGFFRHIAICQGRALLPGLSPSRQRFSPGGPRFDRGMGEGVGFSCRRGSEMRWRDVWPNQAGLPSIARKCELLAACFLELLAGINI